MKFVVMTFLLGLAACSGSSGGGGGSTATVDRSGTYLFHDVECYTSSGAFTNAGHFTGTFVDQFTISGSTMTGASTSGACTVNSSGTMTYDATTYSMTNLTVTSATGGSCQIVENMSNPAITPASNTVTLSTGQALSSIHNAQYLFVTSPVAIGLPVTLTDGAGHQCYFVYLKQ